MYLYREPLGTFVEGPTSPLLASWVPTAVTIASMVLMAALANNNNPGIMLSMSLATSFMVAVRPGLRRYWR